MLRFWSSKLHFWRKSRTKASFLSFKASASFLSFKVSFLKEVSQKPYFWASKLQFWRESCRKASFLSFRISFLKEVSQKSFVFELQRFIFELQRFRHRLDFKHIFLPTQLRHCRSIQVEKYFAPATRRPGGSQKSFALQIMNRKWQQLTASFKSYGPRGLSNKHWERTRKKIGLSLPKYRGLWRIDSIAFRHLRVMYHFHNGCLSLDNRTSCNTNGRIDFAILIILGLTVGMWLFWIILTICLSQVPHVHGLCWCVSAHRTFRSTWALAAIATQTQAQHYSTHTHGWVCSGRGRLEIPC